MRHDDDLPIDPDLDPDDPAEPKTGPVPENLPHGGTRRARPDVLVSIALGGAIGTTLRAALGEWFARPSPQFPSTTLAINLAGSFALGVILVVLLERFGPAPRLRPFLTTGILGGFTTFSTFMVETVQLSRHGRITSAIAYVAVSTVGGVAAALAGLAVGRGLADRKTLDRRVPEPVEEPGAMR
jgi:CrcB protein